MKISHLVAQHINDVFEGNNWSEVNLRETLDDISYVEATTTTKASYNTIAALVHHISFYNEVVLKRLRGTDPEIDAANGFNVPSIRSEADWEELKQRCFESADFLADVVRQLPDEKLLQPTRENEINCYKMLHGISEHTHYHLGQIVLLKKLIRNNVFQLAKSNSL